MLLTNVVLVLQTAYCNNLVSSMFCVGNCTDLIYFQVCSDPTMTAAIVAAAAMTAECASRGKVGVVC